MLSSKYFWEKVKDVKISDITASLPMVIAKVVSPLYKKKYENYWLICEEPYEARDNGFYFFEYLRQKQPQQKCVYAIKENSVDFDKVKSLGETVQYGSLKHWILYFTAKYNISSQKGGKPNAALCSFFELNNIFKPNNIFLQHGITINNVKWLYSNCSKINQFITSTTDEYNFIKQNFGYVDDVVVLTGFPRFDGLHDIKETDNRILIMPTWRYWFNLNSKKLHNQDDNISTSQYMKCWKELLCSSELKHLVEKYNLEIIFYPHRNMQRYLEDFKDVPRYITIASWEKYDIRDLLKSSKLMITDYSSVFFDMVYMKKPVIFYQFDKEKYRKYQYGEGYFDYDNNKFGRSYISSEDVVRELEYFVENKYHVSEEYINEHERIFKYYDTNNSMRIYDILRRGML